MDRKYLMLGDNTKAIAPASRSLPVMVAGRRFRGKAGSSVIRTTTFTASGRNPRCRRPALIASRAAGWRYRRAAESEVFWSCLLPGRDGQLDVTTERATRLEKAVREREGEVDLGWKRVATPMPVNLGLVPRWCQREIDAMNRGIERGPGSLPEAHGEVDLAGLGID